MRLWIEENGTAAYYQEIAPAVNYENKTGDVKSWEASYKKLEINYYHFLKILQRIIIPKASSTADPFNLDQMENLSEDEKILGTKYHVILDRTFRVDTAGSHQVTAEQDMKNWKYLVTESKIGRIIIDEKMRELTSEYVVLGKMTIGHTQLFLSDVVSQLLAFEGSSASMFETFMNDTSITIEGRVFDYTSTGFSSKEYGSIVGLKDDLMDIYYGVANEMILD